ncbi:hypothetical protein [Methylobacterium nonmethylotrophicum]|uniref:N-acetyltransferase domain-containing protein n=1 Tax=Methylobacterium nonmethylotrophicum TaxID=1141884 RepID=A0A4Z0NER8_9HYPH|nr:hypothetical protein [Methylobacterium nonmethylotrophicum]TGD94065.1 hypothetical protein EU555_32610 [Methylobacterium nonmethylotrophicum]
MHLSAVAAADLPRVWPIVEPWLAQACARPGCDVAVGELRDLCAAGSATLVLIGRDAELVAAGVVQVAEHHDGRRFAAILAVGGRHARAWRHTLAQIEDGARRLGCATVEWIGRRGWGRLLPDYAATPTPAGTLYTKMLGAA